jgi:hypothetical protein
MYTTYPLKYCFLSFKFLWPCIVCKVWRGKSQQDATIRCSLLTCLDFKLSPCSLCSMFYFGYFPGVWGLKADVSEPSIGSIFLGTSLGRWIRERVPKLRVLNLRRRGNTQKKTYYILLTSISTCFGHHYAYLQENKESVTTFGVLFWFCWMWLVAVEDGHNDPRNMLRQKLIINI